MAESHSPVAQFALTARDPALFPAVPETVSDLGIPRSMLEQIVLKTLYFRGELTLDMLDLSFNPGSMTYDAPLQL